MSRPCAVLHAGGDNLRRLGITLQGLLGKALMGIKSRQIPQNHDQVWMVAAMRGPEGLIGFQQKRFRFPVVTFCLRHQCKIIERQCRIGVIGCAAHMDENVERLLVEGLRPSVVPLGKVNLGNVISSKPDVKLRLQHSVARSLILSGIIAGMSFLKLIFQYAQDTFVHCQRFIERTLRIENGCQLTEF